MRKNLINEISKNNKISQHELIEKDIIIHEMLTDLLKVKFFSENYIFKGGTCLVKSYLGYYRFSEDMDFTWKNQTVFDKKSGSQIRAYLSDIIDQTGKIIENIASQRDLDFQCDKRNSDYVELGGSNKRCTFKIWHTSEITSTQLYEKHKDDVWNLITEVKKSCNQIEMKIKN